MWQRTPHPIFKDQQRLHRMTSTARAKGQRVSRCGWRIEFPVMERDVEGLWSERQHGEFRSCKSLRSIHALCSRPTCLNVYTLKLKLSVKIDTFFTWLPGGSPPTSWNNSFSVCFTVLLSAPKHLVTRGHQAALLGLSFLGPHSLSKWFQPGFKHHLAAQSYRTLHLPSTLKPYPLLYLSTCISNRHHKGSHTS